MIYYKRFRENYHISTGKAVVLAIDHKPLQLQLLTKLTASASQEPSWAGNVSHLAPRRLARQYLKSLILVAVEFFLPATGNKKADLAVSLGGLSSRCWELSTVEHHGESRTGEPFPGKFNFP